MKTPNLIVRLFYWMFLWKHYVIIFSYFFKLKLTVLDVWITTDQKIELVRSRKSHFSTIFWLVSNSIIPEKNMYWDIFKCFGLKSNLLYKTVLELDFTQKKLIFRFSLQTYKFDCSGGVEESSTTFNYSLFSTSWQSKIIQY